ncbi:unnamed protein product [Diamesa serratosioi]
MAEMLNTEASSSETLNTETKMEVCETETEIKSYMESLPSEVLLRIFSFCDEPATENLTMINKRWMLLVIRNKLTMRNLPLRIHNNWAFTFKIGGYVNRSYHYVLIQSLSKPVTQTMMRTWERVGKHVRQIECLQSQLYAPEVIVSVLNSFPNVQKVSFKSSQLERLGGTIISTNVEENLRHLKTLVMYNNCELDEMVNLALRGIFNSNYVFSKIEGLDIKFKLKRLSLREFSSGPMYGNVLKFLKQQRDNLVHFELGKYFTSDIYEFVFNKLVYLETLFLDVSGVPPRIRFYQDIHVNTYLIRLRLRGEMKDEEIYAKILSLYPNVRDIRISSKVTLKQLEYMRANMLHLTRISLHILPAGVPEYIKFPNLKIVHLDWLDHTVDWVNFLASNPSIEYLSMKWSKNQSDNFGTALETVCKRLPNLRHLKLGTSMNIDMEKIREIQAVCKTLDFVEILDENLDLNYMDDGMMLKKSGFKFCAFAKKSMKEVFPPEDSVWKDDDGDYDSDSGLIQPDAVLARVKHHIVYPFYDDDEEDDPNTVYRTWKRKK